MTRWRSRVRVPSCPRRHAASRRVWLSRDCQPKCGVFPRPDSGASTIVPGSMGRTIASCRGGCSYSSCSVLRSSTASSRCFPVRSLSPRRRRQWSAARFQSQRSSPWLQRGRLIGECVVLLLAKRLAGTPRGDRIVSGSKAARIRRFVGRWGLGAVVVARFLPGGRTAAAATFALRPGPVTGFIAAAGAGSLIWAGYLVGVGSGIATII